MVVVRKVRGRMALRGPLDLGQTADVRLQRASANVLSLGSGDTLETIVAPNATAAFGTASFTNGQIRIGTQGGTAALGFQLNGTVNFVLTDGSL